MGTLNVIELVKEYKVKSLFIFIIEAYQKPNFLPTTEEELKIPDVFNLDFLTVDQKLLEVVTINYLRNSKTKYYILRPHNVYGPICGDRFQINKKTKKSNKFLKI